MESITNTITGKLNSSRSISREYELNTYMKQIHNVQGTPPKALLIQPEPTKPPPKIFTRFQLKNELDTESINYNIQLFETSSQVPSFPSPKRQRAIEAFETLDERKAEEKLNATRRLLYGLTSHALLRTIFSIALSQIHQIYTLSSAAGATILLLVTLWLLFKHSGSLNHCGVIMACLVYTVCPIIILSAVVSSKLATTFCIQLSFCLAGTTINSATTDPEQWSKAEERIFGICPVIFFSIILIIILDESFLSVLGTGISSIIMTIWWANKSRQIIVLESSPVDLLLGIVHVETQPSSAENDWDSSLSQSFREVL